MTGTSIPHVREGRSLMKEGFRHLILLSPISPLTVQCTAYLGATPDFLLTGTR